MAKAPTTKVAPADQAEGEYLVVTPLRLVPGEDPIAPGEPVTLPKAEGDALVACGAVTEIRAKSKPAD